MAASNMRKQNGYDISSEQTTTLSGQTAGSAVCPTHLRARAADNDTLEPWWRRCGVDRLTLWPLVLLVILYCWVGTAAPQTCSKEESEDHGTLGYGTNFDHVDQLHTGLAFGSHLTQVWNWFPPYTGGTAMPVAQSVSNA